MFCRAVFWCTPPMTELDKAVLAVGRRYVQERLLSGRVEQEDDCCAEAAADPALRGSKIQHEQGDEASLKAFGRFICSQYSPL